MIEKEGEMSKMKRKLFSLLTVICMVVLMSTSVFATTDVFKDSGDNVFFGGESATMEQEDSFSLIGSGKDVYLKNIKSKDLVATAGYNVSVQDTVVGSSVFVAGYSVDINNVKAEGNIFAAGYNVDVDKESSGNALFMAAKDITFNGTAKAAHFAAQHVVINGTVNGDVDVEADQVSIGPDAVIAGTLRVTSLEQPEVPSTATVGSMEYTESKTEAVVEDEDLEYEQETTSSKILDEVKSAIYWIVAMGIIGLILCFLFPNQLNAAVGIGKNHKGAWIGSGIATLIGTPILAILVGITFVGLPVAVMMVGFYGLFLAMAVAFTGAVAGRGLIGRINPTVSSLIGIVVFEILMKVPYVGFLLRMCCAVFMLGFVIQYVWRNRIVKSHSTEVVIAE